MTARQSRLDIIKAIIQTQEIGSQDELAQALSKVGVNMTQATLSRDLKLLKVMLSHSEAARHGHSLMCKRASLNCCSVQTQNPNGEVNFS